MVVDAKTGKILGDIPGQKRSHGVALVPKSNRGFITDGQDASVTVFDLKTNQVLGKLAAAQDADGIIYDKGSDRVLVSCGDANQLLVIKPDVDATSGKVEGAVELGGKPEFLAADTKGKAYVNLVDKNEVVAVDVASKKVISRWPVAAQPVGLAIDPAKGRLFVGCRSGKLVVLDTSDGHAISTLPIGSVNDACAFDPATGETFASCGDGTLTVAKEQQPRKFEVIQKLDTRKGAKTMGLDPRHHVLYLPAVEYSGVQAGARPAAKPNSFMVLVVAGK